MHVTSPAFRARFALTPVALVACAMLQAQPAAAQDTAPLVLKPTPMLRDALPPSAREKLPTYVTGDRVEGHTDLDTVIEGHAQLRRGDTVIRADRLEYYQPDDLARARGNVHINRAGDVYEGPLLELKVEAFEGFFNQPRYRFLRNNAYGEADRVDFIDDKRAVVRNATYTTCQRRPGPSWMPDWILRAASIRIDNEEEVGQASGAVLSFKGLPILPVPDLSFPLSDKRKSGLLPPTIGLDSLSGVELTVPYYWDIAPNRDATLYPTLMTKRGVDLAGEFRYLEPAYAGQVRADYMPNDLLRQRNRWGYAILHNGLISTPLPSPLGLNLNLNRVSDDNYWRDFSRSTESLTQRLLANDGTLAWSLGNFSVSARALKWQTLQDVSAPIVPPYDRVPQLVGHYGFANLPGGLQASIDADYTKFESDRVLNNQSNAQRAYTLAQISRPWQAPGWFVVPKLQLHSRRYQFDEALANGATSASVTVPTFSLDSGLVLERNASYFGRSFRQTLEPRAFYVYTPFREQGLLPNYDTAAMDFNFASIRTPAPRPPASASRSGCGSRTSA
jgi:LPS-assembly protein